jgi:hypothetical protein
MAKEYAEDGIHVMSAQSPGTKSSIASPDAASREESLIGIVNAFAFLYGQPTRGSFEVDVRTSRDKR